MNQSRSWRRALCVAALGWLLQPGARAEVASLDSDPPGCYLALSGPVSLSGAAPLPLAGLPAGEYGLIADGPGLAVGRGRLVLSAHGLIGRPWASPAALLQPPGMVHLRRGEQRGWSFLGAGSVSAAMAVRGQIAVRDAEEEAERSAAAYGRAVSAEEILRARLRLLDATREIEDQESVRDLWLGYLAATWIGAAAEAVLLTPRTRLTAESSGGYRVAVPGAGGMKAALRSALVPGAGQRSMGRDGRASVFFTAVAALGAGAITAHDAFLEARRDQAEAQRAFDEAEDEVELRSARGRLQKAADRADDRDTVRWSLVGAAAGVYLWNVLDAFGLGRQPAGAGDLTWSVAPAAGGGFVCATWSVR